MEYTITDYQDLYSIALGTTQSPDRAKQLVECWFKGAAQADQREREDR